MSQSQQLPSARRQVSSGSYGPHGGQQDELHMQGMTSSTHDQMGSQKEDYTPQIKVDYPPPNAHSSDQTQPRHHHHHQPSAGSGVPNVLQPGGLSARSTTVSSNTAPLLSTHSAMPPPSTGPPPSQQNQYPHQRSPASHEYQTPPKPSLSMAHPHTYSLSSPSSGYDGSANYHAYTPTTPSGPASQLMSPADADKYSAPGSQRNFSNTPLGLADIRPRADSSMSDGVPGATGQDISSTQPGPSNYMAPWAVYAFDWCKWPPLANGAGKLAVGSYLEDGHNFIQILDSQVASAAQDVYTLDTSSYSLEFTKVAEATHSYPVTRLLWEPPSSQKQSTDLLATSGDHLRLWSLPSETQTTSSNTVTRGVRDTSSITKLTPLALLSNSKTPDHTAPLTSLDWNTVSPSLIITSSIDTTCTIWDIPSLTAKTQLIAHDKEVYDVRFCANSVDVFVSCGQDGSVRMFDLRSLEHSTIIYEPTGKEDRDGNGRSSPSHSQQAIGSPPPLLRLATSPHDTHLLATFAQDSSTIRILDVRQPGQALLELKGHSGPVNCVEWSPLRRGTLASGGDDCQVLVWDLMNSSSSIGGHPLNGTSQQDNQRNPVASWECEYEVGNIGWVPHLQNTEYGEWLGVSAGRGIWGARLV
ncbi:WD domain containing protein [Metarhizium album ARSEF 1941]|uniref:WD domain containing protein n=1 Tax=Metarhizium album (strain ARSEF 1941) TaxID=1081103 RepID=A0A0B2WR38_METAS|nr:WD domain containing protein [Metarhizium album ARSEF 1941]KHN95440.1 WD domain containing protein [Metarhizium album ARSEF 1941]